MHHRIACKLLEGVQGIVRSSNLRRAGPNIRGRSNVGLEDLIEPTQEMGHRSMQVLLVRDGIGQFPAVHPEKLNVRTRYEIGGRLANDEQAYDSRSMWVIRRDKTQGHKLLDRIPFVILEHVERHCRRQIIAFKQLLVQILDRSRLNGVQVERQIT